MMMLGAFIGVDRHKDPGIRELSGAVRDATALWALFMDTYSDMLGTPVKDSLATVASCQFPRNAATTYRSIIKVPGLLPMFGN